MDQLQQEVTQMAEILKNAVEDSEARIMKHIDVRTDALEDALKKYIDSVVFPYRATIAKQSQATPPVCHSEQPKQKLPPVDSDDVTETPTETLVITTTNSTDHQGIIPPGSVHPGTNNLTIVHDKDVGLVHNGNRGLRSANADSKATPPPSGRLRAAVNTQSRHDVFIGNLSCSTNEDEIRAHLMDIVVESITSIGKVLTKNENSCAMRVRINDNLILHNVYKIDNFEEGIIVKPFRFHVSHTATKNAKNLSHQALNHKNNHMYNNSWSWNSAVNINGYTIVRNDRSLNIGGGVCLYIKSSLSYKVWADLNDNEIESLWISIRPRKMPRATPHILICGIYMPPGCPARPRMEKEYITHILSCLDTVTLTRGIGDHVMNVVVTIIRQIHTISGTLLRMPRQYKTPHTIHTQAVMDKYYAAASYVAPVAVTPTAVTPTAVTPAYPTTYQQPPPVQHQTSIPQTPAYDNTNLRIYPQPCVTNSQTVQQEPKQTGIYPPGTFINNNAGFLYYNTYPSLNHSQ